MPATSLLCALPPSPQPPSVTASTAATKCDPVRTMILDLRRRSRVAFHRNSRRGSGFQSNDMRRLATLAAAACLAAPAAATATHDHRDGPRAAARAACKAERDDLGRDAFRAKYANERG